jgi:hypothetical protein
VQVECGFGGGIVEGGGIVVGVEGKVDEMSARDIVGGGGGVVASVRLYDHGPGVRVAIFGEGLECNGRSDTSDRLPSGIDGITRDGTERDQTFVDVGLALEGYRGLVGRLRRGE